MSSLTYVLPRVLARVPVGIRLGVERTRAACARLGLPDRNLPVLHVAGTNGKGSVSSMCESALRIAGYRTGMFTSPHLCRFAERIQIDGVPIDDDHLADHLQTALDIDPELSFFEVAFVASLLAFREAQVDAVVLEVGLGGRLDATNVVENPLVTSITRIALDHMKQLGDTLSSIAEEKAGIAKRGVPMVLGPLHKDAETTARAKSIAAGAVEVLTVGQEIELTKHAEDPWTVRVPGFDAAVRLQPGLSGAHQIENAAVAATMCFLAGRALTKLDVASIENGIASAHWPGRLETVSDGLGDVLLDAAHNPDGMTSLVCHLKARADRAETRALVFGAMADKQWRPMLAMAAEQASHRFYVEPEGRKAASAEELSAVAPGTAADGIKQALAKARHAVGPTGLVVVAGSIFLAGEARAILLGLERDVAVAL